MLGSSPDTFVGSWATADSKGNAAPSRLFSTRSRSPRELAQSKVKVITTLRLRSLAAALLRADRLELAYRDFNSLAISLLPGNSSDAACSASSSLRASSFFPTLTSALA